MYLPEAGPEAVADRKDADGRLPLAGGGGGGGVQTYQNSPRPSAFGHHCTGLHNVCKKVLHTASLLLQLSPELFFWPTLKWPPAPAP